MKKPVVKYPSIWRTALLFALVYILIATLLGVLLFGGRTEPQPTPQPQPAQQAATVLEGQPLDTRPVLVLDAGHGGHDPGAVDATGVITEAETNQLMVERVMELLEAHEHELKVAQAHQPGTYASPMARGVAAARMGAELMLSFHLNADTSPYTRGFQCFPTPPGRVHHEESMRFSAMLVEQVRPTGIPIMGENGIWYAYYLKMPEGGYGKITVDSTWEDPENPRSDESFGVVEYAGCPAVLIEQWHISNQQDMGLFYNEAGFGKMARCIYLAICEYFGLEPR